MVMLIDGISIKNIEKKKHFRRLYNSLES
jgi:hypothetical protein